MRRSREQFLKEFPVGTQVIDEMSGSKGITQPGRIYDNPRERYVIIDKVDGKAGKWGLWLFFALQHA